MTIQRLNDPQLFFSSKEKKAIKEAIQKAELKTSGEIRVHLQRKIKGPIMPHAQKVFEDIGMTNTQDKNGVLIFMGLTSHQFAILGDSGINDKVPANFWDDIVSKMITHFREDCFADGLVEGIHLIGEKLIEYFPYERDDVNELSDEISYSL